MRQKRRNRPVGAAVFLFYFYGNGQIPDKVRNAVLRLLPDQDGENVVLSSQPNKDLQLSAAPLGFHVGFRAERNEPLGLCERVLNVRAKVRAGRELVGIAKDAPSLSVEGRILWRCQFSKPRRKRPAIRRSLSLCL